MDTTHTWAPAPRAAADSEHTNQPSCSAEGRLRAAIERVERASRLKTALTHALQQVEEARREAREHLEARTTAEAHARSQVEEARREADERVTVVESACSERLEESRRQVEEARREAREHLEARTTAEAQPQRNTVAVTSRKKQRGGRRRQ
jgi:uncharacterized protein (UPF0335 family)